MAFETALRARLKANGTVVGIASTRIDWNVRPQASSYPAVVLEGVFDDRSQHMKGFNSFRDTRVQITCFAATQASAVALRNAVIAAVTPEATQDGVTFRRAQDVSHLARTDDTGTVPVFSELVDMTFWHNG